MHIIYVRNLLSSLFFVTRVVEVSSAVGEGNAVVGGVDDEGVISQVSSVELIQHEANPLIEKKICL